MARQERNDADRRVAQGGDRGSRGNGMYVAVAVGLVLIAGGLAYVGFSDEPVEGQIEESPAEDSRQVGAGTLPDGEADEFREGLGNETTQDDFIEPGAPTEGFTNPQLDVPQDSQPTVPSIDDLDPGPGVDDEVLERMAPDGDGEDADEEDDTDGEAVEETEDL